MIIDVEQASIDEFLAATRRTVTAIMCYRDPEFKKAQLRKLAAAIEASVGRDLFEAATGQDLLVWMCETVESLGDEEIAKR